ncbi:MAG: hypothetical protein PHF84_00220 [bacterium]|nr:hypothetical protein [bacterium]
MIRKKFDIIIFIGRPGAGKSEVIDFLKQVPLARRKKIFHIARIMEMDDFNFLIQRGSRDDVREKKGQARLDTLRGKHSSYRVKSRMTYVMLTRDINQYFLRHYDSERFYDYNTLFLEFSRGGRQAYQQTLEQLDPRILKRAVLLYIRVSFRESMRKNKKRFDPGRADSILYHKVPYQVMLTYRTDDWARITARDRNYILLNKQVIPYLEFNNEPEKTNDQKKIGMELQKGIDHLLDLYNKKEILY